MCTAELHLQTVPTNPAVRGAIMLRICALLAALLAGSVVAVGAEPEHGSRDQAVAMVQRVEIMFRKDGADATFKAVTAKTFNDRDLYPFVYKRSEERRVGKECRSR